jgi:CubicO group peptidase (beta-lactamase class C family)
MTRFLVLFVVACSSPPAKPVPPPPDPIEAKLDAFAREALAAHQGVGFSIAVAHGDRIVAKGYGLADAVKHIPATENTVYRIGSITKQFTAVAILQLAERGQLDLHDDIHKYVELPSGPVVTLEHLLTHTSGIVDYTGLPNWKEISNKPMSRGELVAMFATKPMSFAPGERWAYSNSNYYLLGLVIEKVTKQSYADAIRERVLRPAGMTASGYCDDHMANRAEGYKAPTDHPVLADPLDMAHPYAAGALCSTVGDLIAWQRALEAGKLVSAATLAKMRTNSKLAAGTPTGYGYGVFLGELDGHARVGHGGGINGFISMLARYPADDLTIAVLGNAETDAPEKLEVRIARAALGLPEPTIKREQLAHAQRQRFVGDYVLVGFGDGAMKIRMFEEGDLLRTQASGQPAVTLLYQGNDKFVLDLDHSIEIVFAPGEHAPALTIHQSGMAIEAKRAD